MTTRHLTIGAILAVALLLSACSDDTEYNDGGLDCGQGQDFAFDGGQFCLYSQDIIEEGFNCPAEVANRFDFDGFVACGGDPELPPGFEEEARREGNFDTPNNDLPVCGDGVCSGDEDADNCTLDCKDEPNNDTPDCGDGVCEAGENPNNCALDCDPDANNDTGTINQQGLCIDELPSPFPPERHGAFFQGQAGIITDNNEPIFTVRVTSQEQWDGLQGAIFPYGSTQEEDLDFSQMTVDFNADQILAITYRASSTCNDIPVETQVGAYPDTGLHVSASFTYTDGACESVCDAEGHALVLVLLPASMEPPTTCITEIRTCNE